MSTILGNPTPEQHYELARNKVIADNVGLTNFNAGSDIRSILEACSIIASILGFDFLEAIRQAIPIALYDGLTFTKKGASISNGYLRFYRLPVFTILYSGADADVKLSISGTQLTLVTSGTPSDDVTVNFATFNTIDAVVAEIDSKTNWSATKVQNGSVSDLYLYSNKQIVGNTDYKNVTDSIDVMNLSAPLINILSGTQVTVDDIIFQTTAAGTIDAGNATSAVIAASSIQTGDNSNISAQAIDTLSGKGTINTSTDAEHVINDSAFANGREQETDAERASRFQLYIQGLTTGTKAGIESAILNLEEIKSVTMRARYPVPGTNTIIADDGTGNLSTTQIDLIRKVIEADPDDLTNYPGKGTAGINYNIEAPSVIAQNVAITIYRIGTNSDETEIKLAVQTAIEQYINTRRLGDDVIRAEIIERAMAAHPACYNTVLATPSSDVSISLSEVSRTGSGTGASVVVTLVTYMTTP